MHLEYYMLTYGVTEHKSAHIPSNIPGNILTNTDILKSIRKSQGGDYEVDWGSQGGDYEVACLLRRHVV
jgi:hypothetical protein